PLVNAHGNHLSFGVEAPLLKTKERPRILEPYLNLSAGDKVIAVYSQVYHLEKKVSHHLALTNDIGMNIRIPFAFRTKRYPLSFSAYHRFLLLYSLTPGMESREVNPDNSPYAPLQHMWGMGIRFDV